MRPIDADAYADKMRKKQKACNELMYEASYNLNQSDRNYWEGAFATFVESKLTLDNMPTIDAVPVVQCKDCGYSCACYSDDGEDLYECCKDVIFGNADTTILRTPNWFCADGKRYDE